MRKSRLKENMEALYDSPLNFIIYNKGSWVRIFLTPKKYVDFYPATTSWIFRSKTYSATNFAAFLEWCEKFVWNKRKKFK